MTLHITTAHPIPSSVRSGTARRRLGGRALAGAAVAVAVTGTIASSVVRDATPTRPAPPASVETSPLVTGIGFDVLVDEAIARAEMTGPRLLLDPTAFDAAVAEATGR
jgi:hypothetical protein